MTDFIDTLMKIEFSIDVVEYFTDIALAGYNYCLALIIVGVNFLYRLRSDEKRVFTILGFVLVISLARFYMRNLSKAFCGPIIEHTFPFSRLHIPIRSLED